MDVQLVPSNVPYFTKTYCTTRHDFPTHYNPLTLFISVLNQILWQVHVLMHPTLQNELPKYSDFCTVGWTESRNYNVFIHQTTVGRTIDACFFLFHSNQIFGTKSLVKDRLIELSWTTGNLCYVKQIHAECHKPHTDLWWITLIGKLISSFSS